MYTRFFIILAFAYLYGFFEFYMNVRLKKKSSIVKSSEKGSIRFLFTLIQIACLLSFGIGATKIGGIDDWNTFIIIGAILILFGFMIRISSIMTLKRHYTYTVTRIENHELIESGLYKTIRHPGYLGLVIIFLGISTALSNWLSVILMIVPVIIGIMNRIRVEESFLVEQMGQKYTDYQKRTKRLIPKIF